MNLVRSFEKLFLISRHGHLMQLCLLCKRWGFILPSFSHLSVNVYTATKAHNKVRKEEKQGNIKKNQTSGTKCMLDPSLISKPVFYSSVLSIVVMILSVKNAHVTPWFFYVSLFFLHNFIPAIDWFSWRLKEILSVFGNNSWSWFNSFFSVLLVLPFVVLGTDFDTCAP